MKRYVLIGMFILCSILFFSKSISAEKVVFNPVWQQQFEYDGYSVETTSAGNLLNISYTIVGQTEEIIYDYYLLNAKTGATLKEVRAIDGYSFIFQSEEKEIYIIAYEREKKLVSLYNENLEKVWSKKNTFGSFEEIEQNRLEGDTFLFFTKSNPLIPIFSFDLNGKKLTIPTISYELPTIEQCPGEEFCQPSETVDVLIQDKIRKIDKTVTIKPTIPEGHIIFQTLPIILNFDRYYSQDALTNTPFNEPDRYFLFIGTENDNYEATNRLVEFNLNGEIIRELLLPAYQTYFDYTTNGNVFAFAADDQYTLYNLADFSIKKSSSLGSIINYMSLDYDANKLITADSLFLLNNDLEIEVKLERPSNVYSSIKKLSNYVIIRSINVNDPSFVYDLHSLEFIATIPNADDYIDANDGKDIISYTTNMYDYTYQLGYYSSLHINSYSPLKTWTIAFNQLINPASVNEQTIYVMNERGEKVNVTLHVDRKKVQVIPAGGYVAGFLYTLYVEPGITARNGAVLSTNLTKSFLIE